MAKKQVEEPKFEAHDHSEYWNNEFQSILDDTSDINYNTASTQLRSDVEFLTKDFSRVKEQMNLWAGSTSSSTKEAIETIMDKFDCTMENINDTIDPACSKIETFKELLTEIKQQKELLTGSGGLDWELKEATRIYEGKKLSYNLQKARNLQPKRRVYNEKGQVTGYENNPEYESWKNAVANAETEMNEAHDKMIAKQEEITAKEEEIEKLLSEAKETYQMINDLVSTIRSFKDYLGGGAKADLLSDLNLFSSKYNDILLDINSFALGPIDYTKKSPPVLLDEKFFEEACKQHADEGWKIEDGVVTMKIGDKECTYDLKKHLFSNGDVVNNKPVKLEAYFYLPSHIVEQGDYNVLKNLNTYTFFSSNQKQYVNTLDQKEINTFTIKVIKQDPLTEKYGTVASLTKTANTIANTNLNRCQNCIGGDSVYGAHSLKIAASNGDLYKTVYCVDNAAIVTGVNGKAGTKEQFASIEDLKGLDGKNVYFINTSGDDNYSYHADMSIERGRAYVPVSKTANISVDQVKTSFTYTGIELVAKNCPNAKIHVVYQCEDTAKTYQRENFPVAIDHLARKYPNVWNESNEWGNFMDDHYYKTHSEGNFVQHHMAQADATNDPNYDKNYKIENLRAHDNISKG